MSIITGPGIQLISVGLRVYTASAITPIEEWPVYDAIFPRTVASFLDGVMDTAVKTYGFKYQYVTDGSGDKRITSVAGVAAPEGQFWQLTNKDGKVVDKPINKYTPFNGSEITFRLQTLPC